MIDKFLEELRKREGGYCGWCGIFFDDIIAVRKHHVESHYDYVLAQCRGNKQLLLDSIKEFEGLAISYPNHEVDF